MKSLTIPEVKNEKVFFACVESVRMKGIHLNFLEKRVALEKEYLKKAKTHELHTFKSDDIEIGISHDDLKYLYTRLRDHKDAREYYDFILKNESNNRKCPYCDERIANELDHYLPKSEYPLFAITVENLVPICSMCNREKLAKIPSKIEEEIIHPYFDDVESENWLRLKVIKDSTEGILFEYFVSKENVSCTLWERLNNTLDTVGLKKDFSALAASEFRDWFDNLMYDMNDKSKWQGIGDDIRGRIKSCESRYQHRRNSWRYVLYKTFNDMDEDDFLLILKEELNRMN